MPRAGDTHDPSLSVLTQYESVLFACSERRKQCLSTETRRCAVNSTEGQTRSVLKRLSQYDCLLNPFVEEVMKLEARGASEEELAELLGKGRAKKGIFEGDLESQAR